MRKSLQIPAIEQEKRKARYNTIYQLYKDSSLEALKEAYNDKKHRSSTDKAAIGQLTHELMLKQKGLDEPIELNKELDGE